MTENLREKNFDRARMVAPLSPAQWGVPIYSWLAISNFSPFKDDLWVRGVEMPFEIVLMPGYRRPTSLVTHDIDSIWYDGDVLEPLAVWDGMVLENLFELISASMDPAAEMTEYIRIRDRKTGEFISDPRPKHVLSARPQRQYVGGMIDYARFTEKVSFFEKIIPIFYDKNRRELGRGFTYGGFQKCYHYQSKNHSRKAESLALEVARRHPDVDTVFLRGKDPGKIQVVPGMKFGLALFNKEIARHPEWIRQQLQLDYLIETGSDWVATPYQQASYKKTRGIPLSEDEIKTLQSGGDYATPGVRKFLDKFNASLKAARPAFSVLKNSK